MSILLVNANEFYVSWKKNQTFVKLEYSTFQYQLGMAVENTSSTRYIKNIKRSNFQNMTVCKNELII